jgi:beta-phosphoglucomutase family hydrolase
MTVTLNWSRFGAALFDLDGVITPTAEIHERAWSRLFARWDFSEADYLEYVDGKPRYEGVQSFLHSRGVDLPWGSPDDPPGDNSICAMGNRKNDAFNEVLERDGIGPYPGTLAVLKLLDAAGIAQAIVSSSKNARTVLAAAGLGDRFPVIVDGVTAAEDGIPGKPAPDMFEAAAHRLGVETRRCIVIEDASSGVKAGVAGDFAFVLGVDRGGNQAALLDAGAHLVVSDLADTLGFPMEEPS